MEQAKSLNFKRFAIKYAGRVGVHFSVRGTGAVLSKRQAEDLLPDEVEHVEVFGCDASYFEAIEYLISDVFKEVEFEGKPAFIQKLAIPGDYIRFENRDCILLAGDKLVSVYSQPMEKQNVYLKAINGDNFRYTEGFLLI